MRIDFFGSILIVLIVTLLAKGSAVFGKVQERAQYAFSASSSSVLMDLAYAKADTDTPTPQFTEKPIPDKPVVQHAPIPPEQLFIGNQVPTGVPTAEPKDATPTIQSNIPQLEISTNLSSEEVKLLKELSKRRDELNKTQEEMQMRENVLRATENKIQQKIQDLKSLQSQVDEAMKAYREKEEGKIKSLVRIYENMKPKDAAKIFDALEMPVLLNIVSHMKETKVSPILASMQTNKASELSVELTKQKSIGLDDQ